MAVETDYLIIGGGATGMAFADTLLDESDARITIVDRHAKPGGHWNDAYSFVALHQPSAYYGVNSSELGSHRMDTHGPNAGFYEQASGPEINAYFDKLMQQKFLPSGRVSYLPMSDYLGDGHAQSVLSGTPTHIQVRKKQWTPPLPASPYRRPIPRGSRWPKACAVPYPTPCRSSGCLARAGRCRSNSA